MNDVILWSMNSRLNVRYIFSCIIILVNWQHYHGNDIVVSIYVDNYNV